MSLSSVQALLKEEDGQDLVEYALLMVFIALAAIALLSSAGGSISRLLGGSVNTLSSATAASANGAS